MQYIEFREWLMQQLLCSETGAVIDLPKLKQCYVRYLEPDANGLVCENPPRTRYFLAANSALSGVYLTARETEFSRIVLQSTSHVEAITENYWVLC